MTISEHESSAKMDIFFARGKMGSFAMMIHRNLPWPTIFVQPCLADWMISPWVFCSISSHIIHRDRIYVVCVLCVVSAIKPSQSTDLSKWCLGVGSPDIENKSILTIFFMRDRGQTVERKEVASWKFLMLSDLGMAEKVYPSMISWGVGTVMLGGVKMVSEINALSLSLSLSKSCSPTIIIVIVRLRRIWRAIVSEIERERTLRESETETH